VAEWESGISAKPTPGVRTVYKNIVLLAPNEPADATVVLYVDGVQAFEWTWNLDAINNPNELDVPDLPPFARVASLSVEGYSAYATLTVTNRSTENYAIVYSCSVLGSEKGAMQSTASNDGSYTNVSP
jgi:hypothetical protein